MPIFKPTIYKKTIHDIDYNKLYKKGIRCLIFDLDNTLGLLDDKDCPKETVSLINKLKKKFKVVIITNNSKKRVIPYAKVLDIDYVTWALKPSIRGLMTIKNRYDLEKEEMAMIGDQIVTDILSGNRYQITTVLVDPLGKKDLKVTTLNRFVEDKIVKKYEKKKIFSRGRYYE